MVLKLSTVAKNANVIDLGFDRMVCFHDGTEWKVLMTNYIDQGLISLTVEMSRNDFS